MNKRIYTLISLTLTLLFSYSGQATELDINISGKSINAQLNATPPQQDVSTAEYEAGLGYIYREGGTNIINLDFHALGQTALNNWPTTVKVGASALHFNEDSADGAAIAFGGGAHIKIPTVPGLGIKAEAHFAPSITSFGDADRVTRLDIRSTYRVKKNADVYAGYRIVKAKVDDGGSQSLDENIHIGFTLHF